MKGKAEKAKVIGVSIGADGTTWCCDSAGFLYRRHGSHWHRDMKARALEVAVGSASNVWCRNREGSVFQLQSNSEWEKDKVASNAATISVGSDGTVWVGNSSGKAVMATGLNQWSKENPNAKDVVEVTVGDANNVWCRNGSGKVFKLKSSSSDSGWDEDTAVSLVGSIAAGSDGTVWLTNTDPGDSNRLYKREGKNNWSAADPKYRAAQVSVGRADRVRCVNDAGQIFWLDGSAWNSEWKPLGEPDMPTIYIVQSGDILGDIVKTYFSQQGVHLQGAALTKRIAEVAGQSPIASADNIDVGDVIVLEE